MCPKDTLLFELCISINELIVIIFVFFVGCKVGYLEFVHRAEDPSPNVRSVLGIVINDFRR